MHSPSQITLYGTFWCSDCRRARRVLARHDIPYQDIDIDKDPEARALVEKLNQGNRSVPTILFPDETILVEPSDSELMRKLKDLGY